MRFIFDFNWTRFLGFCTSPSDKFNPFTTRRNYWRPYLHVSRSVENSTHSYTHTHIQLFLFHIFFLTHPHTHTHTHIHRFEFNQISWIFFVTYIDTMSFDIPVCYKLHTNLFVFVVYSSGDGNQMQWKP